MLSISKHANQLAAIVAAKQQAIEESLHNESGIGEAIVLTLSGDTRTYTSKNGGRPKVAIETGWVKDGHLNVPAKIYDMIY